MCGPHEQKGLEVLRKKLRSLFKGSNTFPRLLLFIQKFRTTYKFLSGILGNPEIPHSDGTAWLASLVLFQRRKADIHTLQGIAAPKIDRSLVGVVAGVRGANDVRAAGEAGECGRAARIRELLSDQAIRKAQELHARLFQWILSVNVMHAHA